MEQIRLDDHTPLKKTGHTSKGDQLTLQCCTMPKRNSTPSARCSIRACACLRIPAMFIRLICRLKVVPNELRQSRSASILMRNWMLRRNCMGFSSASDSPQKMSAQNWSLWRITTLWRSGSVLSKSSDGRCTGMRI